MRSIFVEKHYLGNLVMAGTVIIAASMACVKMLHVRPTEAPLAEARTICLRVPSSVVKPKLVTNTDLNANELRWMCFVYHPTLLSPETELSSREFVKVLPNGSIRVRKVIPGGLFSAMKLSPGDLLTRCGNEDIFGRLGREYYSHKPSRKTGVSFSVSDGKLGPGYIWMLQDVDAVIRERRAKSVQTCPRVL
jgi:hypothetical protein